MRMMTYNLLFWIQNYRLRHFKWKKKSTEKKMASSNKQKNSQGIFGFIIVLFSLLQYDNQHCIFVRVFVLLSTGYMTVHF